MRNIELPYSGQSVSTLGTTVSNHRIIVLLLTAFLLSLLGQIINYIKVGRALKATALATDSAALMGVNINLIYGIIFAISSGLDAVAGGLIGSLYDVGPSIGALPGMKAFIISNESGKIQH